MKYQVDLTDNGRKRSFSSSDVNELFLMMLRQYSVWKRFDAQTIEYASYHPAMMKSETEREELKRSLLRPMEEIERTAGTASLTDNLDLVKQIVNQVNNMLSVHLSSLGTILVDGLNQDVFALMLRQKDFAPFEEPRPQLQDLPGEPKTTDQKYFPLHGLIDKESFKDVYYEFHRILGFPKEPFRNEARFRERPLSFEGEYHDYRVKCNKLLQERRDELKSQFEQDHRDWSSRNDSHRPVAEKELSINLAAWEGRKKSFLAKQEEHNRELENRVVEYSAMGANDVTRVMTSILMLSDYPIDWKKDVQIVFNSETCIAVLDYSLPAPEDVECEKAIKLCRTKTRIEEVPLSGKQTKAIYEDVLYQITLRSMHEVYRTTE